MKDIFKIVSKKDVLSFISKQSNEIEYFLSIQEILKQKQFEKIPITTNDIIKKNIKKFINKNLHDIYDYAKQYGKFSSAHLSRLEKIIIQGSSGTTGAPSVSIIESDTVLKRIAYSRLLNPSFASPEPSLTLTRPLNMGIEITNKDIVPVVQKLSKNKWKLTPGYNPAIIKNSIWLLTYNFIINNKIKNIHADPAYLAFFSRYCANENKKIEQIKYIQLNQNFLTKTSKKLISCIFPNALLQVKYNSSELGEMGFSCKNGYIHLLECNAYYEFFTLKNKPAKINEVAFLVISTIDTKLKPLLRFMPGDLVSQKKCPCKIPYVAVQLEGRANNIITKNGKKIISTRMIDAVISKQLGCMGFYQAIIDVDNCLITLITPDEIAINFKKIIYKKISELVGKKIKIDFVNDITKFNYVIDEKLQPIIRKPKAFNWITYFK